MDLPAPPRYGSASVADVLPSILAALGVDGFDNVLDLPEAQRTCLLLVDGLGAKLLRRHHDEAPFLSGATQPRDLDAAFPATTVTSLASLTTGLPPGRHGLVGVTIAVPGQDRPFHLLRWEFEGRGDPENVPDACKPEQLQPEPTLFVPAAEAGLDPAVVAPAEHEGSGLSQALFRQGRFVGTTSPDELVEATVDALASSRLVYAYHGQLDAVGHERGVAAAAWRRELKRCDRLAAELADQLPAGTLFVVTSDHGMVDLDEDELVDLAARTDLAGGVRVVAGEARMRHVHAERGAEDEVLSAWRQGLGSSMWVLSGEEAIEAGWFGGRVEPRVRRCIGDVVAAARGPVGVVQLNVDPLQAAMIGHHGSLTDEERLVPFIALGP